MISNICFINNYNNALYIRECLESVYAQSRPFDAVLVVDDGSTDRSLEIIEEFASKHSNLKLLIKENEGQFSTFNAVLPLIPNNSQIFILDGDDIFAFDYLEKIILLIGTSSWDFAFCEQQAFTSEGPIPLSSVISNESARFLPSTSALVRSRECWIGNPTSCISLSSNLYKKIFPYPYFQDKSFWADNLMIYASSILGAKKIHIPSLGIGWRVHALNDSKKVFVRGYRYQRIRNQ
jgi:glycosyltransferase involved in cell wall biosynthesis